MTTEVADLDQRIKSALKEILDPYLEDITFRIGQAYEVEARAAGGGRGTVFAEDLNLPNRHHITGYTVTNNSPAAGSIAWADLNMVYAGQKYAITNGNTALKFVWWSPTTTPTALQSSNTKPTLAVGEVLLFTNVAGTHKVMLSDTNASMPGVLSDGTVDSGSIIANAVTSTAILDGAVTTGKMPDNAITTAKINTGAVTANELGSNAVTDTKIATGAVTGTKILDGAVGGTKITDGAIATAKLADGAVTTAKLPDNAITSTKILDGAVTSTELGSNAVTSAKLADGAVSTAAKLADGIVSATKVADGAVTATKMNIMRHMIW